MHEPTPLWAIELGLTWPCDLDDVERRGRELAKANHPDLASHHSLLLSGAMLSRPVRGLQIRVVL